MPHPNAVRVGTGRSKRAPSAVPAPRTEEQETRLSDETRAAIQRFHDALNSHDAEAVGRCITDDCVFEDTTPPDGTRYEGRDAMLDAVRRFLADSPAAHFEIEETFTAGDRALVRWRYAWADGHVRGADVIRVRDGRVAESLAYVKG
jgi:ketosteroid isomerase-like protein